jgi:hypothetical protein
VLLIVTVSSSSHVFFVLADGRTFALLVGNSKAVWAPFIAACVSHDELLQEPNPFDSYVERSVEAVCSDALPG